MSTFGDTFVKVPQDRVAMLLDTGGRKGGKLGLDTAIADAD